MQRGNQLEWPTTKTYRGAALERIAMPLGGIGAGSISMGGCGDLRDWELFNHPSKNFIPFSRDVGPSVMIHTCASGESPALFLAEGPVGSSDYSGCVGSTRPNHGIPRFRECEFDSAYPLAQVTMKDDELPLDIVLQAFSPVIPGDAANSSLPIIQMRYRLKNTTDEVLRVSAVATVPNFIGLDPQSRQVLGNGRYTFDGADKNFIRYRQCEGMHSLQYDSNGENRNADNRGTFCLSAVADDVSYRTSWLDDKYQSSLLDFYNDLNDDGRLSDRIQGEVDIPVGSLAVHLDIPPGAARSVVFFLTWHFPNRMDWTPGQHNRRVGNWYAEQFRDAGDVARSIVPNMAVLESRTVDFVAEFCASDLPGVVKEAMLSNLSTLFTETCHRLPDGTLCGFEGCGDNKGYCEGSCTHVWNYEHTLPFLFGELACGMREVEFGIATGDQGDMPFRIMQPYLERARDFKRVAADGQMGCVIKMYRDWQLGGDFSQLLRLWPAIKNALAYCWIENGWDADRDGVMEGCQHNTMDVEYYGPNPQMQGWYLGALLAASHMAEACDDADFAAYCRQLFVQGREWTDRHLFNGSYYEQDFRIPECLTRIPDEHRLFVDKPVDGRHQLLDACLVDQLVGHAMSGICGLGDILDPKNIRTTLSTIASSNQRDGYQHHFNVMRSFALGEEKGLLMASYPRGSMPEFPFPYFSETMTGFEYTAAISMIIAGLRECALTVVENIRNRYDGFKRNPFDEAECGHHYVRAMAAWGLGVAWTGFSYSAVNQTMTVNGHDGRWFWSNGYAWGSYSIDGMQVRLVVGSGELPLSRLVVRGKGSADIHCNASGIGPGVHTLVLS